MAYKINYVSIARQDLRNIFHYYAEKFSTKSGQKVLRSIRKTVRTFSFDPESAINFDQRIGKNLIPSYTTRMILSKKFLILYIVYEKSVQVIRILNSQTDYRRHLELLTQKYQSGFYED